MTVGRLNPGLMNVGQLKWSDEIGLMIVRQLNWSHECWTTDLILCILDK